MSWVEKSLKWTEISTLATLRTMRNFSSTWATCHKLGMMQTRIALWRRQKLKVNTRSNYLTLSQLRRPLSRTLREATRISDLRLCNKLCHLILKNLRINSLHQLRKNRQDQHQGSASTWTRWIRLIQAMWTWKGYPQMNLAQTIPHLRMTHQVEAVDSIAQTLQPLTT